MLSLIDRKSADPILMQGTIRSFHQLIRLIRVACAFKVVVLVSPVLLCTAVRLSSLKFRLFDTVAVTQCVDVC